MKISIIKMAEYEGGAKATIHATGKLGFNDKAIRKLGIEKGRFVIFGQNDADENDKSFYLKITDSEIEHALPIIKAGRYYYLSTKPFFDAIGFDYKKKRIIFDIGTIQIGEDIWFKLTQRVLERKQNA